jgi:hypothetical protein
VACPACGGKERLEEDTLTGDNRQGDWGLDLAAEALERARHAGATDDLERVLHHARLGIEQRLAEGRAVDRRLVDRVGLAAAQVAAARAEAAWGRWALSIYASLGWMPPLGVTEQLASLPASERSLLAAAAQRASDSASGRAGEGDVESQTALAQLFGSVRS